MSENHLCNGFAKRKHEEENVLLPFKKRARFLRAVAHNLDINGVMNNHNHYDRRVSIINSTSKNNNKSPVGAAAEDHHQPPSDQIIIPPVATTTTHHNNNAVAASHVSLLATSFVNYDAPAASNSDEGKEDGEAVAGDIEQSDDIMGVEIENEEGGGDGDGSELVAGDNDANDGKYGAIAGDIEQSDDQMAAEEIENEEGGGGGGGGSEAQVGGDDDHMKEGEHSEVDDRKLEDGKVVMESEGGRDSGSYTNMSRSNTINRVDEDADCEEQGVQAHPVVVTNITDRQAILAVLFDARGNDDENNRIITELGGGEEEGIDEGKKSSVDDAIIHDESRKLESDGHVQDQSSAIDINELPDLNLVADGAPVAGDDGAIGDRMVDHQEIENEEGGAGGGDGSEPQVGGDAHMKDGGYREVDERKLEDGKVVTKYEGAGSPVVVTNIEGRQAILSVLLPVLIDGHNRIPGELEGEEIDEGKKSPVEKQDEKVEGSTRTHSPAADTTVELTCDGKTETGSHEEEEVDVTIIIDEIIRNLREEHEEGDILGDQKAVDEEDVVAAAMVHDAAADDQNKDGKKAVDEDVVSAATVDDDAAAAAEDKKYGNQVHEAEIVTKHEGIKAVDEEADVVSAAMDVDHDAAAADDDKKDGKQVDEAELVTKHEGSTTDNPPDAMVHDAVAAYDNKDGKQVHEAEVDTKHDGISSSTDHPAATDESMGDETGPSDTKDNRRPRSTRTPKKPNWMRDYMI